MRDFRDIKAWSKSHRLALEVYEVSRKLPNDDRYGLTSQMRRAVMSNPTNIAEGCGRESEADFARFLQIAPGSASELEYQLLLARDLCHLSKQTYEPLNRNVTEVKTNAPFLHHYAES